MERIHSGLAFRKMEKLSVRTHDFANSKKDVAAHAETEAVKLACDNLKTTDLSGCVLYATCEPCPLCFTVIHLARIKKVVFGMSVKYGRKLGYLKDSVPSIHIKKLLSSPVKILVMF